MKKFFGALFLASFFLNFVWEVTQAPLYAALGLGTRELVPFIAIRWWASFGDALTILAAYFVTALVFRDRHWAWRRAAGPWIFFLAGLTAWQALVEYVSVYVWHRWAYGALMPTIFGIGLSPLLQMIVLPWAAVVLGRRYLVE